MQQEEEAKTHQGGNKPNSQSNSQPGQQSGQQNSHHVNKWKAETGEGGESEYGEYIDMEMEDDCVSDVESET